MEKKLEQIEVKVDKLDERLDTIEKVLIKQNVVLEDHTRRSLANEKAVEILKDELKEVFNHVIIVQAVIKLAGFLLTTGIVWKIVESLLEK